MKCPWEEEIDINKKKKKKKGCMQTKKINAEKSKLKCKEKASNVKFSKIK